MDPTTARKLNAINRAFYHDRGAAFAAKRAGAWSGWRRLLPELRAAGTPGMPLRLLDAGCGNGRFGDFLAAELERPARYCGVDASAPLLDAARQRVPAGLAPRFVAGDLIESPATALPDERFDAVVAFGLLHHVPSIELRRELMRELAARVAPNGRLVVTFWDFAGQARFADRRVSWEEHNRTSTSPIDCSQLESGDVLLRWGDGDPPSYRYCHFVDPGEREALIEVSGLRPSLRFQADGGLNDYRLLCRNSKPSDT